MEDWQALPPLFFDSYELHRFLMPVEDHLVFDYYTKDGKNQAKYRCVGLTEDKPNGIYKILQMGISSLSNCDIAVDYTPSSKNLSDISINYLKNGEHIEIRTFPYDLFVSATEGIVLEMQWKTKGAFNKEPSIFTVIKKTPVEEIALQAGLVKRGHNFPGRNGEGPYNNPYLEL